MNNSLIQKTRQWWQAKAGFLVSVLSCYLAAQQISWQSGLWLLVLLLVTILAIGTFGHFINDLTDIEEDRKAGKRNFVAARGPIGRILILFLLSALSILPWFIGLEWNGTIKALLLMEAFLFVVYSVPPVRLKRFPTIAAVTDALYAYVNPTVFFYLTFVLSTQNEVSVVEVSLLILWTFPLGLRHILNHHVADRNNDRLSNTPNLAVTYAPSYILKFIRYCTVPFEMVFGAAALLAITMASPALCIAVVGTYCLILLAERSASFPYTAVRFGKLLRDTFQTQWLGIIALILLTIGQWRYGLALIIFLALFTGFFGHPIFTVLRLYAGRTGKAIVTIITWPFRMASLIFNWSLYYFRKWVLNWSEERNWGAHYEKRIEDAELDEMGNVAVFNRNLTKSSETFVRGQLNAIPNRTAFFHGWPKPMVELGRVHLTDPNVHVRNLIYGIVSFTCSDRDDYDDNRIADRLLTNNTVLMVAHFGPMGAALTNVSEKTGIPLVVVFHGYDAWNRDQLEQHTESYKQLFSTAVCVIGVSRDICLQLKKLGCNPNKIEYLPAYMDLDLFEVREQRERKPTFLYVGRFTDTKSPMLVIMAFSRVLKEIPDARLVMIGSDDGEGLYQPCHILAAALKLNGHIDFKGTLSHSEVHREMENASIFVQHSVTTPISGDKEGTPVGIMEAMAVGMPIIATDHAGISEMLQHGKTGILVKEFDMDAMAEEMIRLGTDAVLQNELGKNAAKAIRKNERVADNMKLFLNIIKRYKLKT